MATHSSIQFSSVQFSRSVVSDSVRPHESQHTRPTCTTPTPGVHSDSCPLSQWCHPTMLFSAIPFSSAFNLSQHRVFSNESVIHIRWAKYWSFSFRVSPSNEYSGLISFRMDWLGEGGRRGVQDGEHMYTCGGFMLMCGKTNTIL